MFTLRPKQEEHATSLYESLVKWGAALDTSDTGTGKTITSVVMAHHLIKKGFEIVVVCPAAVVPAWERALLEQQVEAKLVISYDKLRRGHDLLDIKTRRRGKKVFKYFAFKTSEKTLFIFDEVQYCKGEATQNANLLVAAKKSGGLVLGLSATAAAEPPDMKALGYVLGLHDHNKKSPNSWEKWLRKNGCAQDPWYKWRLRKNHDLTPLRKEMYETKKIAHGMRVSDLPEDFKGVSMTTAVRDFPRVKGAFEEAGIDEDYINKIMGELEGSFKSTDSSTEKILRARQFSELEKISYFREEAESLLGQGFSVVLFVNFRETIKLLQECFRGEAGVIIGGQDPEERQEVIDKFSKDDLRIVIVSSAAGGTGVSLHDINGNHPRYGLVSPTFSPFVFKQVLGRLPRVGMKTPATYQTVVAADTIEEYVHKKCEEKIKNMNTLFTDD